MKNWRHIALHAVAAASFIFLLQRYVLHASLESCLLWAVVFAGCAAGPRLQAIQSLIGFREALRHAR
jgi:hypothetical protein